MIELVTSGTTTKMNVWSPLSTNTTITTPACSNNTSFLSSSPFIQGITLPTDGVVYVEDYTIPTSGVLPTVPNDGSTPCFNPYQYALDTSQPQCYEGDVYLEGELNGQLTVGSTANIIITRDLTYYCASGSGPASQTDPSSVPACEQGSAPNVLGLSAKYDVLISGNQPTNTNPLENPQDCASNGFGDGTGTPPLSGSTINHVSYPNDPDGVWPTICNPKNVVIDAAILAVSGSFGVENWDTTPNSDAGNAYLNGADLSYYRGPFGYTGQTGYYKEFSYDQRLAYLPPPNILPAGVVLWQENTYDLCPNAACTAIH